MHIEHQFNLQAHHTFGTKVFASAYTTLSSEKDIYRLKELKKQYDSLLILGGGSNVLFTKDYPGIVVQNHLESIKILSETNTSIRLKVASGVNWHQFVLYCVEHGWGGIENLSLIPGTVGAAPMQNIGAYGVEVKDVILEVIAYDIEQEEWKHFSNESCQFGYRESIFKHAEHKHRYFIAYVIFELKKAPHTYHTQYGDIQKTLDTLGIKELSIQSISNAVIYIRNQKLPNPKDLGNAGSFFKNPEVEYSFFERLKETYPQIPHYLLDNGKVKIPAGWLIEQCGWKGLKVGNTGNHQKQSLVIVNYGNATGLEIVEHARNVQQSVKDKFGIDIHPEVNIISD